MSVNGINFVRRPFVCPSFDSEVKTKIYFFKENTKNTIQECMILRTAKCLKVWRFLYSPIPKSPDSFMLKYLNVDF